MANAKLGFYGAVIMALMFQPLMAQEGASVRTSSTPVQSLPAAKKTPAAANSAGAFITDMTLHKEEYQAKAEAGDAPAQFKLGLAYLQGIGVHADAAQAAKWLQKALESYQKPSYENNADAEYNIGSIYAIGVGVPKDMKEATLWWEKSANHGNTVAQLITGSMYISGAGVAHDMVTGDKWLRVAALQGDPHAGAMCNSVEKTMNAQDIAKATAQAKAWKDAHSH